MRVPFPNQEQYVLHMPMSGIQGSVSVHGDPRGPLAAGSPGHGVPSSAPSCASPALLVHAEHGFAERGTCWGAGSGAELCSALGFTVQRTFNVK